MTRAETEQMFVQNLPLAAFALNKYRGGYDEDDLQVAYIALWKAVLGYRGGAFSTYAVRAILNEMKKVDNAANQKKRIANKMADSLTVFDPDGREHILDIPCPDDLAERAAVSEFWRRAKNELPAREYDMLQRRQSGLTLAEIGKTYGMSQQAVSQIFDRKMRPIAESVFGPRERKGSV